jgi:imidazolonepropionase-like amidohydrolase
MAAPGTLQGQTIVIEDGRISRMGSVGEVSTASAHTVDGVAGRVVA